MRPVYRIMTVPYTHGEIITLVWTTWMNDGQSGRGGYMFDESRQTVTFYKLIDWR